MLLDDQWSSPLQVNLLMHSLCWWTTSSVYSHWLPWCSLSLLPLSDSQIFRLKALHVLLQLGKGLERFGSHKLLLISGAIQPPHRAQVEICPDRSRHWANHRGRHQTDHDSGLLSNRTPVVGRKHGSKPMWWPLGSGWQAFARMIATCSNFCG